MLLRTVLVFGWLAVTGCGAITAGGTADDDDAPGGDRDGGPDGGDPNSSGDRPLVTGLFRGGPYRTPIAANPALDPRSSEYVKMLNGPLAANTIKFGVTVRYSFATDPTYRIRMAKGAEWGEPFDQAVTTPDGTDSCNPLHIPADLAAPPGDDVWRDGWVYIIDTTKRAHLLCAIWRASKVNGEWTGDFGGVLDTTGTGANLAGSISGSNIPHNPVLASEIERGAIDHALSFASSRNDPKMCRAPATKTDGKGAAGGLQQGMLFQLDPNFDCAGLANRVESIVCTALQKYGMYDNDSTTGTNGFLFETDDVTDPARRPPEKPGDYAREGGLYAASGLMYDYQTFPNIPLTRMRLLQTGTPRDCSTSSAQLPSLR